VVGAHFIQINLFCTADHHKRFTSHEGGWAGSKSDWTTFRGSDVWLHRGELIKRGERLSVDKGTVYEPESINSTKICDYLGFFVSPYTVRPYEKRDLVPPTSTRDIRRRKAFNKRLSSARVCVEHAFGLLKKRFPAVNLMGTSVEIETTYRVLEALLALHNLCIDYGDKTLERFGDDTLDESETEEEMLGSLDAFPGHIDYREALAEGRWDGFETDAWLTREGNQLREELRQVSHLHQEKVEY
jgi:hypothetical protein